MSFFKSFSKSVLALLCAHTILSCGQSTSRNNDKTINEGPVIEEPIVVKDTIDILIEERAEQLFNSTIFAGLRLGCNRNAVEKALRNKHYRTFIPIYVPIGDKVDSVVIRDYDASYYNEQLTTLVLYADDANLYDALGSLYTAKYGLTKGNLWSFSNCEVSIEKRERRRRPHTTYDDMTPPYYASYRGEQTDKLIKEAWFLAITYNNKTLLDRQVKDENDALAKERQREYEERQKKREQEKELARQLSTEVPTNI